MSLAVCITVRDGEATIPRAIESVRPFVDEICVYESRSSDRTLEVLEEIAAEPGAPVKVERGGWRDDYGWAWRQAFAMVSPDVDWTFWLEDDEELAGGATLRQLDAMPAEIDHLWARRDHVYADGNVFSTWQVRATRPDACEWLGRVHEALTPQHALAFTAAVPHALTVRHPRATPMLDATHAARVDEQILAAARDDPEATPWLRHHYVAGVLRRRGDFAGAEAAWRAYLDETAGQFEHGRLGVHDHLVQLAVERGDVFAALGLQQARAAELEEWRQRADAGELGGLEALGPDFWAALNAWQPPQAERNDPCPCGSGAKFKRCCDGIALVQPAARGAA